MSFPPVKKAALLALLVLGISFITYFRNYSHPPSLFWDENYHIASAQKYLNHTFFMEPHPPLGKMFIALGEYILHPNTRLDTRSFLRTDYITEVPAGYSFAGVRFFPTLFAALSSVLFFLILHKISQRAFLSFLFTSLYLFENAIIVHSRGAMLESIQLFFVFGLFLYFIHLFDRITEKKPVTGLHYLLFGAIFGLVMAVKLNGFMCIMFFLMLVLYEESSGEKPVNKKNLVPLLLIGVKRVIPFVFSSLAVFIGIYYLHFSIAIIPMNDRYYEASEQYKQIINKGKTAALFNVPYELTQNIAYSFHYEKGVPVYDVCKPGENGSLPITWPFGAKGINYRWTTLGTKTEYLYLQGNPVIWFSGLVGLFLAVHILTANIVLRVKPKNKRLFTLMVAFLMFYVTYMASMITIERVMYLYHYFIPLTASLILFFLVIIYLFDEQMKKGDMTVYGITLSLVFLIVISYVFFSPLTYYGPLTATEFRLRSWLPFWGLKSVP